MSAGGASLGVGAWNFVIPVNSLMVPDRVLALRVFKSTTNSTINTNKGTSQPGNLVLSSLQARHEADPSKLRFYNSLLASFKVPLTHEWLRRMIGNAYANLTCPVSRRRSNGTTRQREHKVSVHRWLPRSLQDWIIGRGTNDRSVADWSFIRKVCVSLAQACLQLECDGFVHGDLKPDNVMTDTIDDESFEHVVFVDFDNVLRLRDGTYIETPSGTHFPWGHVDYVAPEVYAIARLEDRSECSGQHPWAIGLSIFEAIFGEHPFPGNNGVVSTVDSKFAQSDLRGLTGVGVDEDLCAVVADLLETDPANRCSLAGVLCRLSPMIPGPVSTPRMVDRVARLPYHAYFSPPHTFNTHLHTLYLCICYLP